MSELPAPREFFVKGEPDVIRMYARPLSSGVQWIDDPREARRTPRFLTCVWHRTPGTNQYLYVGAEEL